MIHMKNCILWFLFGIRKTIPKKGKGEGKKDKCTVQYYPARGKQI